MSDDVVIYLRELADQIEEEREVVKSLKAGSELYLRAYELTGASDISEFLALCGSVRNLEQQNDRLLNFCTTLENRLLKEGDPFSGDDWNLMQEVRVAMGKQQEVPT